MKIQKKPATVTKSTMRSNKRHRTSPRSIPLQKRKPAKNHSLKKSTSEELALLKKLVDQSSEALYIIDIKTERFCYANDQACKNLLYSRKELLNMRVKDISIHYTSEESRKEPRKKISKEKRLKLEDWQRRKDGSIFPVEVSAKLVQEGDNNLVIFSVLDITERKKSEEDLLRSKEKFQNLFEFANDSIFISDPKTRHFLDLNENAYKRLGYTKEELLNKSIADISVTASTDISSNIEQIKKKGSIIIEAEHIHKNGSIIPVEISSRLIEYGDKRIIQSFVRDITERKKAEENLKESIKLIDDFFEKSPIGLHMFGPDQKIIQINQAELDMIGYSREEILGKKTWADLIVPEQKERFEKHWQDISNSNIGGVQRIEYTLVHKDGHHSDVLLSASARFDDEGKLINTRGNILDITERKKYEQALQDSKQLVEQEVERKTKKIHKLNLELKKHAKNLGHKIKRIDETRVPLTDKEKLAFYGLVKYPNVSSKEIASKIYLPGTTVNSIKKRLIKEGYFKTMIIPRLDLMEASSLLSIHYSSPPKKKNSDNKELTNLKNKLLNICDKTPENTYSISSDKYKLSILNSRDWEDCMEYESTFNEEIRRNNSYCEILCTVHFPIHKSRIFKYFDFSELIHDKFDLVVKKFKEPELELKSYKPNSTEMKLIYGLIKFPEYTVAELSKVTKISVPTICKLRKRLFKNGLLKKVNFPDFRKIGMELIVLNRHELMPDKSGVEKEVKCSNPNVFFSVQNKTEYLTLSLYENYTDAQEKSNKCQMCNIVSPGNKDMRIIIPIESISFAKFDYAPLVKKLFALDVDY